MFIEDSLMRDLQKETSIHLAQIRALYRELDKRTGLHGASIPVEFTFDQGLLGSYTRPDEDEKEHFTFSLLFIGYAVKNQLSKADREDLYRHEYAHYMQYNFDIPKEYRWQTGTHGSTWKYCCSIVDAAPTPYYKAGEALMKHDYDKALKNPIHDRSIPERDVYRREQTYKREKKTEIRFDVGDIVKHPKYGEGIVTEVTKLPTSVRLKVDFDGEIKAIDQEWIYKQMMKK